MSSGTTIEEYLRKKRELNSVHLKLRQEQSKLNRTRDIIDTVIRGHHIGVKPSFSNVTLPTQQILDELCEKESELRKIVEKIEIDNPGLRGT